MGRKSRARKLDEETKAILAEQGIGYGEETLASISERIHRLTNVRDRLLTNLSADEKPKAWIYLRVSTARQGDEGLSLLAQLHKTAQYVSMKLPEQQVFDPTEARALVERYQSPEIGPEARWWAQEKLFRMGIALDVESASKVSLAMREWGGKLHRSMRKGDSLVIQCFDRAFRSTKDAINTVDDYQRRGIRVHFVDFGGNSIDFGTPTGRLIFTTLSGIAQFEADQRSERLKQAFAESRRQHASIRRSPPMGYLYHRDSSGKVKARPDQEMLDTMAHFADLYRKGVTPSQIWRLHGWAGATVRYLPYRTSKVRMSDGQRRYQSIFRRWSPEVIRRAACRMLGREEGAAWRSDDCYSREVVEGWMNNPQRRRYPWKDISE